MDQHQILACPWDHSKLAGRGAGLMCEHGHSFDVEGGIPILTESVRREYLPRNMPTCRIAYGSAGIDEFVNQWLVNTNGNLYRRARGNLRRYPIPRWPFDKGSGKLLLDIGCGWGRWMIAAARAGYQPIGLDVHFDALAAATRVTRQLGMEASFVCGDAAHLPFRSQILDAVFSYSSLQHLERATVIQTFSEIARVLKPGGSCIVQMPNIYGIYNLLRQAVRGFRDGKAGTFEMRYWSESAIRRTVKRAGLQGLRIMADGFFTQNPQIADLDLLSPAGKLLVLSSLAGCKAARSLPTLTHVADSLWVVADAPPIK